MSAGAAPPASPLSGSHGRVRLAPFPGGALGPLYAATVFDAPGSYRPAFTSLAVLDAAAGLARLGACRGRLHLRPPARAEALAALE